jgi:hypothetical protein|tara:strand:+ start:1041 stop:1490 length:450 start_codon:yes stop_codon:yes gene_type:complete
MEQPPLPPQILPIEARWCLEHRPTLCIALEVADHSDEQRLGLMQRPALPPLRGMWFPAQPSQPMRFWMYNTIAPLDMLFIRDGRVLDIASNVPICPTLPCASYWADADGNGRADFVDGVIEIGAGEASRLGIRPGDAVAIEAITGTASP